MSLQRSTGAFASMNTPDLLQMLLGTNPQYPNTWAGRKSFPEFRRIEDGCKSNKNHPDYPFQFTRMDNGAFYLDVAGVTQVYTIIADQFANKQKTDIFPLVCVRGKVFRMFVDLDIKSAPEARTDAKCIEYAASMVAVLNGLGFSNAECIVATPTPPAGATKSGCHIVFPNVEVNVQLAHFLYHRLLERLVSIHSDEGIDWPEAFDKAPYGKSKKGDNGALRILFVSKSFGCSNCKSFVDKWETDAEFKAECTRRFPAITTKA
eukprot:g1067.t1